MQSFSGIFCSMLSTPSVKYGKGCEAIMEQGGCSQAYIEHGHTELLRQHSGMIGFADVDGAITILVFWPPCKGCATWTAHYQLNPVLKLSCA